MTRATATPRFRERLLPGPGLFIALLLCIPAVAIVTLAFSSATAIAAGVGFYIVAVVILILLSPTISVADGTLTAGHARIPAHLLGEVTLLGSAALREAIGPGLDARAFTLVRGWIHTGVRIENTDPNDPAPYWVLTSRRPQALADAIANAR